MAPSTDRPAGRRGEVVLRQPGRKHGRQVPAVLRVAARAAPCWRGITSRRSRPTTYGKVRGDEGQGADYLFTWLRSILRVMELAQADGRAVIHELTV